MLKITETVPASSIWPTAENYIDRGEIPGLMRGYNLEVVKNGQTDWMSAEWVYGNPEEAFNDDYHQWSRSDWGLKPTGRVCFRGYGIEEYSFEERETFVKIISDEESAQRVA